MKGQTGCLVLLLLTATACVSGGMVSRTPSAGAVSVSPANDGDLTGVATSWHWQRLPVPTTMTPTPREDLSPLPVPTGPLVVWDQAQTSGALASPDAAPGQEAGVYDVAASTWTSLTNTLASNTPKPSTDGAVITTSSELIVWGGLDPDGQIVDTGGVYNFASKTWHATSLNTAPSARRGADAYWNGQQLVVYGGTGEDGGPLFDGGSYKPSTDAWTRMFTNPLALLPGPKSVVEQHSFLIQGHLLVLALVDQGDAASTLQWAAYSFTAPNIWAPVSLSAAPVPRRKAVMIATTAGLFVWGGELPVGAPNSGGYYDLAVNQWQLVPSGGPTMSSDQAAVATNGSDLVALLPAAVTGQTGRNVAVYQISASRWQILPNQVGIYGGVAAFLTNDMLAVLAWDPSAPTVLRGLLYDQAAGTTAPLSSTNGPSARLNPFVTLDSGNLVVWSGSYQGTTVAGGSVLSNH